MSCFLRAGSGDRRAGDRRNQLCELPMPQEAGIGQWEFFPGTSGWKQKWDETCTGTCASKLQLPMESIKHTQMLTSIKHIQMLKSIGHTDTHKAECHGRTLNFTDESCNSRKQAAREHGRSSRRLVSKQQQAIYGRQLSSSVRKTDYTWVYILWPRVNRQPPTHQLRMRRFKPFWGWTKNSSSSPAQVDDSDTSYHHLFLVGVFQRRRRWQQQLLSLPSSLPFYVVVLQR